IGEFSPFDFVLLLIISEGVSNALMGDDHSITAGIIIASTLCLANYGVDVLVFKNKKVEKVLEGEPQILVSKGKVDRRIQKREMITDQEIDAALRQHGIDRMEEVAYAVLESDGHISVIKTKD